MVAGGFEIFYGARGNYCPLLSVRKYRAMLIFKRRHAHVRVETLSEYLDGRLQESVAARVDRRVIASGERDPDGIGFGHQGLTF